MLRFTIHQLLKNKVLWAWPIIVVLLALFIGWDATIQSAGNSYSFLLALGDGPPIPGGLVVNGLISFLVLIAVIGVPTHFSKNLESERASLILSKPINRSDLFFAEFAGVFAVMFIYTLITVAVLAVLLAATAGIFPHQLLLAVLLYIPLYFMVIYISIALLLIMTSSYLASVLIAYFLIVPLSGFLLRAEWFLQLLGFNSDLVQGGIDVLSYIIPSAGGMEKLMASYGAGAEPSGQAADMMSGVLYNGFGAFDWSLFGFVIVSCIPFFLLSYYLMQRKEF